MSKKGTIRIVGKDTEPIFILDLQDKPESMSIDEWAEQIEDIYRAIKEHGED